MQSTTRCAPQGHGRDVQAAVAVQRKVLLLRNAGEGFGRRYERAARQQLAAWLARLNGLEYGGEVAGTAAPPGQYCVPDDTLLVDQAAALGIRGEQDLFGGVVPFGFVATKALTQPLVAGDAVAPTGWSHAFHQRAPDAVLRGFTVFSIEDARRAAERMLQLGPFRIKPVRATGGRGQVVVQQLQQADDVFTGINPEQLQRDGLVLEENLEQVTTLSIGRITVAGLEASYHGTQALTTNHRGRSCYGGSSLVVVRGGLDALARRPLPPAVRTAVAQARAWERHALELFPGMLLSRSNYDVAQGIDGTGQQRSGVLEQSWRIGGATPAELAALQALRDHPQADCVHASCHEVYGPCTPPPHATVLFSGVDPQAGDITLYACVDRLEPAAVA